MAQSGDPPQVNATGQMQKRALDRVELQWTDLLEHPSCAQGCKGRPIRCLVQIQQRDSVAITARPTQGEVGDIDAMLAKVRPNAPITPGTSRLVV